jgi:hypothetical protein
MGPTGITELLDVRYLLGEHKASRCLNDLPQSAQRSSESGLTVPTFSMQTAHGSIRSDSNNSFVLSLSAISTTLCGTARRGRFALGHTPLPLASLLPPEFPLLPSGRAITYTRPFPNAMACSVQSGFQRSVPPPPTEGACFGTSENTIYGTQLWWEIHAV